MFPVVSAVPRYSRWRCAASTTTRRKRRYENHPFSRFLHSVPCWRFLFVLLRLGLCREPARDLSGAIRAACFWCRAVSSAVAWLSRVQGPLGVSSPRSAGWAVTHMLWQFAAALRTARREGSVGTPTPRSQRWMQHIIRRTRLLGRVYQGPPPPCLSRNSITSIPFTEQNRCWIKMHFKLKIQHKCAGFLECEAFSATASTCGFNSGASE